VAIRILQPKEDRSIPKVTVHRKDEVYFFRGATETEAKGLGEALEKLGLFHGTVNRVILSRDEVGPVISFALTEGGWEHPETVFSFEEIGRRVAPAIGGLPIKVRLTDPDGHMQKELNIGRLAVGTKDDVYYLGSATAEHAAALGMALQRAGYLVDSGNRVVLSKDGGATTISFVVADGVWDHPSAVARFEQLARKVAPSVGGLPVDVRLLDSQMETRKVAKF
jgi:hypothetical protein